MAGCCGLKKEGVERVGKGMEIKVLGPGCKNCKALENAVRKTVEEMGVQASVEKVEDLKRIAALGVLMTPGLIINGKIKSTGRVPKTDDIAKWVKEEMDK
ncbi:MAG: thioredoxin family protein [Bacillota bacterium]